MSDVTKSAPRDPARMWNVLCHASALVGLIIPLGFILGPLVVWLIKKGEFPSVNANGKEALNFQISCFIYIIIAVILSVIGIGHILLFLIGVADLILIIIASVKVGNGESFSYPASIRFIK